MKLVSKAVSKPLSLHVESFSFTKQLFWMRGLASGPVVTPGGELRLMPLTERLVTVEALPPTFPQCQARALGRLQSTVSEAHG